MNKQSQLIYDDNINTDASLNDDDITRLGNKIQRVEKFLSDNRREKRSQEEVARLLNENVAHHKKAQEIEMKLDGVIPGEVTKEEIVNVVREVLYVLDNMAIKSLKLYFGAYKRVLYKIFDKYPMYHIRELFKEEEIKSFMELFNILIEKTKVGIEGSRGVYRTMKALRELGDLLDIYNTGDMICGNSNTKGITLNLNVNSDNIN